jgi:hypothetical protein
MPTQTSPFSGPEREEEEVKRSDWKKQGNKRKKEVGFRTDETRLSLLSFQDLGAEVGQTGGNKDDAHGEKAGDPQQGDEGGIPEGNGHFL